VPARRRISSEMAEPPTWIFLGGQPVPDQWQGRAFSVTLVPLLPEEAERLLAGEPAGPVIGAEDEPLARLAARGLSTEGIAHELHLSPRSVQRRLGRLRRQLGLASKSELTQFLAARGFALEPKG
jgi:DNA-binding CsgD family transcriptional regulator